MIYTLIKHVRSNGSEYEYSVVIPSWNNLPYLKLCISSIKKNCALHPQIIVVVNEGKDGTIEWLRSEDDIDFVLSPTNIGVCYALNIARTMVKSQYIVYLNDDMYVLPNWDKRLMDEISNLPNNSFLLSSTMIEPVSSDNKCVVVRDFGRDIHSFQEDKILSQYEKLERDDWSGSTWPPTIIHRDLWDLIGGYSIEFSPGLGSDPDFSRKLYEVGVRHFKGVGNSLVYHFVSKSTARIRGNNGRKMFLNKWGISQSQFREKYLELGSAFHQIDGSSSLSNLDKVSNFVRKFRDSLRTS